MAENFVQYFTKGGIVHPCQDELWHKAIFLLDMGQRAYDQRQRNS